MENVDKNTDHFLKLVHFVVTDPLGAANLDLFPR